MLGTSIVAIAPALDLENTWHETHGAGWRGGNDDDDDPSLAHTLDVNQLKAQKNLSIGFLCPSEDLEEEHDGREPCSEDEGAQCEDEGAQCEDEGADEHYAREGAL